MPMTAEQRSQRARDAALASHESRLDKYRQQVDPDGTLPAEERDRLAAEARREHMAQMGRRSGQSRRENAPAKVLEAHIRALVDAAPALTDEQRTQLAALLNTPAGDGR